MMAQLATLEGVEDSTGDILDRLFEVNDTLGVLIYGVDGWNKIKSFVADYATKVIVENRGNFGRWSDKVYNSRNDILDKTFGFNDRLGVELLGGNGWNNFVCNCKRNAAPLGSVGSFVKSTFTKPIEWTKSLLVPDFTDPLSVLGIRQVFTPIMDISGETAKQEKQKAAYEQYIAEQQAALEQSEAEKQRIAQDVYDAAYSQAKQEYDVKSTPAYQNARTNNILIIGGLGLLALMILKR